MDSSGGGDGVGGSLGMPAGTWQWGLPTESLRLGADELELAVDPQSGAFAELGEGAHGSVFAAKLHGRIVACKVFELDPGSDTRAVWREVSMLRVCSHPRIVPLLGVSIVGPLLLIAMELMKRGSLRDVLQHPQQREKLRWRERGHQVACDVAEAVDHLHTRLQVMHSDIKAANVLLCANYRASLADLGVAQVLHSAAASGLGFSSVYGAPEQLMGERCTEASDIYGFGVLLIELTTRQLVERRGVWRLPEAPHDCPQGVVDLIRECVQQDPQRRPSAAQLRQQLLAEAD